MVKDAVSRAAQDATEPLLQVSNLSVGFNSRKGDMLAVLRAADITLTAGESLGLVGESGSGKSTLALAMMGYLKRGLQVMDGGVRFAGHDMFTLTRKELERIRGGRLALIPQNSGQSLTPTLKIGAQVSESLRLHSALPDHAHPARVIELLEQVRLPDPPAIAQRYPHELSGGQQQRAAIAMALAGEPEVLLLDEPTTGLDVTTQAHILELLRDLASQSGMAMVYVSHDLGAIARVCDRVVVMYAGEAVLEGSTREVLRHPAHPYARGLLAAIPRLSDARLPLALDGRPPAPGQAGMGCAFVERCAVAEAICRSTHPGLDALPGDGRVRCHYHERAVSLPTNACAGLQAHSLEDAPAPAPATAPAQPILTLEDLSISYARPRLVDQLLRRRPKGATTVEGISLSLARGETLGLVGESGSGKSTILKAVAGLLPPAGGSIRLADEPLPALVDHRRHEQLRRVQLIFQNPDDSLNPRQTIAEVLAQPLTLYFGLSGDELRQRSSALLDRVRLGAHYLDRLPSQLSGGEKQRVAVARAFAAEPDVVLCDEVTSALDVSVQAAVLDLLDQLRRHQGTAYVFVSHDLAVVRALSDRVAVLYQGRLCEVGPVSAVYAQPSHPYTTALMGAVLEPDPDTLPTLSAADIVELAPPASGCAFQRRCPRRLGTLCDTEQPPWQHGNDGHAIRCHITRERL